MSHQDATKSYALKTIINELSNAASTYSRSMGGGLGANVNVTSELVSITLGVALGSRKFPLTAFGLNDGEVAASTIQRESCLALVSEVGESVFLKHHDVVKHAQTIFASRYNAVHSPVLWASDLNIKDYSQSVVPGSYGFVSVWLPRLITIINDYSESYYNVPAE